LEVDLLHNEKITDKLFKNKILDEDYLRKRPLTAKQLGEAME